jgi:aspartate/methionine/tyrosine aminotransferase
MSGDAVVAHAAASSGSMDFKEFIVWSQQVKRTRPEVRRYCETRITRGFGSIRPSVDVPGSFATVHRCDLAQEWCDVRGLPSVRARTTLVCQGVRHGLGVIFAKLAQAGQRVALPLDVYPVYWSIASEAGVDSVGVETFPNFDLPAILDVCVRSRTSFLMLPNPLKLHGRKWTEEEVAQAVAWLGEDSGRRLILDGVYSFGLTIDGLTNRLIETDQVIFLDSLSKGWLHELTMGVATVPDSDFRAYANSFQSLRLPQEQFFRARAMLGRFRDFPNQLANEIDERRDALMKLLRQTGAPTLPTTQGYLIGIEGAASDLLEKCRLLTIPATVFGTKLRGWAIASALPEGNAP